MAARVHGTISTRSLAAIRTREVGAAAEGEIDGQEAGSDGQRAGEQVCGVEKAEQEVKYHRHRSGKYQHKGDFTTGEAVDLYLGMVALEGVAQPGHQRHHRHGAVMPR